MVQISPPLVAGEQEIDELVGILGDVLAEADAKMRTLGVVRKAHA